MKLKTYCPYCKRETNVALSLATDYNDGYLIDVIAKLYCLECKTYIGEMKFELVGLAKDTITEFKQM